MKIKIPHLSGEEVTKILVNKFGFLVKSRSGSHVLLIKFTDGEKVGTVVPMHKELKTGTFLGILRKAKITIEEFMEKM